LLFNLLSFWVNAVVQIRRYEVILLAHVFGSFHPKTFKNFRILGLLEVIKEVEAICQGRCHCGTGPWQLNLNNEWIPRQSQHFVFALLCTISLHFLAA